MHASLPHRFDIPSDTSLVCLVGENGSGKSNLLELVAGVAHRLGMSSGIDSLRGDPFNSDHELSVTLALPRNPESFFGPRWADIEKQQQDWSGMLRFTSVKKGHSAPQRWELGMKNGQFGEATHTVGGIAPLLRQNKKTNYLYLDANRSYPHVAVNGHEFGEIIARDWDGEEWGKSHAHLSTNTLYQEWIRYLVATEAQAANRLMQKVREAAEAQKPHPEWVDHFTAYKTAIKEVLPHLRFVQVSNDRNILFDSAGTPLNFYQLSGGEREIAFLIGQVFRFGLERGLFLIDEPELHLNADLLRVWVAWLRDRVADGQTWLATHSMEAAEIAGPDSVFVLKRAPGDPTRRVTSIQSMANQPLLQTLSKALGSPAFSITDRKFVWIEGEPNDGEKARFHAIFSDDKSVRFLESGNCDEVVRRVHAVRALADASGQHIRVTGIIDRDFRTKDEIKAISELGLHVLPCHEIENLFIYPATLAEIALQLGQNVKIRELIVAAADQMAGRWVTQNASASGDFRTVDLNSIKKIAGPKTWADIGDGKHFTALITAAAGKCDSGAKLAFAAAIGVAIDSYRIARETPEFWRVCMGKEITHLIAKQLGTASAEALERAVIALWSRRPELRPEEHQKVAAVLRAL